MCIRDRIYMVALFSVVLRDRDLKQLAGAFGGMLVNLHFTNPKSMSTPIMVYMDGPVLCGLKI